MTAAQRERALAALQRHARHYSTEQLRGIAAAAEIHPLMRQAANAELSERDHGIASRVAALAP